VVDRAFEVLTRVAQPRSTRWSIVYDQTARTVHFRTDRHATVRTIRLGSLDLSCEAPVRMLDVQAPVGGDVTSRLGPYTPEANRALVLRAYCGTSFLQALPEATLDAIARHPETSTCDPARRVE